MPGEAAARKMKNLSGLGTTWDRRIWDDGNYYYFFR